MAIIGLGKMGLLHASLLKVLPDVDLVGICDKSSLLTRIGKKVFEPINVTVVNDIEKFADLDLDAVYITTPISSHFSLANTLVTQNIARNVFCEKTLTSSYKESKMLTETAEKVEGVTMVGYMKRLSIIFRKAKQLLDQKELGEVLSFKAFAYSSDFQGLAKESKSSAARGGALRDIGCHVIDLGLWLLGDFEPTEVKSCIKTEADAETSVSFTVSNSDGVNGLFEVSQTMANYRLPEFGLLIECSKGNINVNDDRIFAAWNDGLVKKWYKQDLDDSVPFFLGETEYFREDRLFVDALKNHAAVKPAFAEAAKVDHLIEQVKALEAPQ